jgi:hypothetical protein
MDEDLRRWIQGHLAGCDACREAAGILKESLEGARDERGRPATTARLGTLRGGFSGTLWNALSSSLLHPIPAAAYLMLLVLIGVRQGSLDEPTGLHEGRPHGSRATAPESGLLDIAVLSSAMRGERAAPVVSSPPGRTSSLALGLDLVIPESVDAAATIRIALFDESGRRLWSEAAPVSRLRERLRTVGLILVRVPAQAAGTGSRQLLVEIEGPGSPMVLLDSRFVLDAPRE